MACTAHTSTPHEPPPHKLTLDRPSSSTLADISNNGWRHAGLCSPSHARSRTVISNPSMCGICTSDSTKLNCRSCISFKPLRPLFATVTRWPPCRLSNALEKSSEHDANHRRVVHDEAHHGRSNRGWVVTRQDGHATRPHHIVNIRPHLPTPTHPVGHATRPHSIVNIRPHLPTPTHPVGHATRPHAIVIIRTHLPTPTHPVEHGSGDRPT